MSEANLSSRLDAFSHGAFAIALTLLIVDIRIPSTVKIRTTAELWAPSSGSLLPPSRSS